MSHARLTLRRRPFLLLVVAGLISPTLPTRHGACAETDPVRPPNIVFIIADDLGWADVGYHASKIKTPSIDRLAREGRRFERFYVAPTCTPTRVGFMSGRYPSRFGVLSPAYGKIFEPDTPTIASVLRDGGYDTHICGKWHMGSPPDSVPRRHGFATSYGYFHGQIDPYTHLYKTGVKSWHRNDAYVEETGHATDLLTRDAVRFIQAKRARPFFLYVAYSVPHYPLDEPDAWTAPYRDVYEAASRRWFAASVTHMDQGIGEIEKALHTSGHRERTVLIFVSDNGGQKSWSSNSQYKGRYKDKPHTVLGDNRPLRGWKGDVYEGGIRVPGCIHWPGVLTPGVVSAPLHIVDWMPTLCRLAGCRPKTDIAWDGRDVWPLITGAVRTAEPRTMYWKTPGATAVRRGDVKLIIGKGGKRVEMYDLAADPYEKQDLASERPEQVAELKALMARIAETDRKKA